MSQIIGNRYQIVKHLGKGGMADVYLAFDTILHRDVAVKILKSDLSNDDVSLERFKREAGATTQLFHPNIVEVYDVGDDNDKHYIVMEYIKGYTLKQLIKKRGAISYKETVWIMKQLASALLEAHRNNIIHRDVKSQNVLVKDDGTIKLSDFGIALAGDAMQITSTNSVLGSVHYLAPELSKGKQATMQSDIYSLGIVMYELLTGDVPFKADTPIQVALKHIRETIPSVKGINPDIPQSVENIVIKATAKSLNNRYENVALMLQDLNECLNDQHLNDEKVIFDDNSEILQSGLQTSQESKANKKTGMSVFFLICCILISMVVLLAFLFLSGIIGNNQKKVVIPYITGMSIQDAEDTLAKYNLYLDKSSIEYETTDNIAKNLVVSCNPGIGIEVESGSSVKIVVSEGIYSVLNNYVGKNFKSAKEELDALNFNVRLIPCQSEEKAGTVIEQSLPEGYKFNAEKNNEIISLKYAIESSIIIPIEIQGMNIDDACAYLSQAGIPSSKVLQGKDFFSEDELKDSKPDTVIKTSPMLGSLFVLDEDNSVTIYYYSED